MEKLPIKAQDQVDLMSAELNAPELALSFVQKFGYITEVFGKNKKISDKAIHLLMADLVWNLDGDEREYPKSARFRLNREDMNHLIRGGEVKIHDISLIMADIGHFELQKMTLDALRDGETRLRQVKGINIDQS